MYTILQHIVSLGETNQYYNTKNSTANLNIYINQKTSTADWHFISDPGKSANHLQIELTDLQSGREIKMLWGMPVINDSKCINRRTSEGKFWNYLHLHTPTTKIYLEWRIRNGSYWYRWHIYISPQFYICHGATALFTLGHVSIQLTFHCSAWRTWRSSLWVIYVEGLCKVCNPLCRLLLTIKHNPNFLVYWRMFHPYWFTVFMCNNSMLI